MDRRWRLVFAEVLGCIWCSGRFARCLPTWVFDNVYLSLGNLSKARRYHLRNTLPEHTSALNPLQNGKIFAVTRLAMARVDSCSFPNVHTLLLRQIEIAGSVGGNRLKRSEFQVLTFSQKHLRCLASRLVNFAAGGAIRQRRQGGWKGKPREIAWGELRWEGARWKRRQGGRRGNRGKA